MARNAEKAMTTLARFRAAQLAEQGKGQQERRPFLACDCDDLKSAEKWRRQIIGEISKKVAQIQNAGLGEFRIREINDEINKLLREKGHWEARIIELGGKDYSKLGPKMLDHEGKEVPGNKGYKYFGSSKDLPGVRELFEQEPPAQQRRTRTEMMKNIDADYYGYRDNDDGILIPLEKAYNEQLEEEALEKRKESKDSDVAMEKEEEDIYAVPDDPMSDEEAMQEEEEDTADDANQFRFIAHVPVPTQQEFEEALLKKKKDELMKMYASLDIIKEAEETKSLIGK
ncbi:pre-mRNA-splicing factor ISY1 homolog [Parasteatoda tepidariorum]|uniref:pre-mRNA-splicing factor ISY1 homolog n=1 Tax=Parasteatoda tepidariorum TaxID=114398 RepID=UPI00077F8A72|nr:pre-mRNA-splicing factor ISY1 homolog [Parasteatoda tepidariorum]